jgi:hypothetical protein
MKAHIPHDQMFTGNDPVAVMRFLDEFKHVCDDIGLPKGAHLYMFQSFLIDLAKKILRLFLRNIANKTDENSHRGAVRLVGNKLCTRRGSTLREEKKSILHQQKSNESEVKLGD